MSSGISCIVDAVKGDGLTGLEGLLSELKVLINDRASGTGAAFALLANVVPPPLLPCLLERMILRGWQPSWLH